MVYAESDATTDEDVSVSSELHSYKVRGELTLSVPTPTKESQSIFR